MYASFSLPSQDSCNLNLNFLIWIKIFSSAPCLLKTKQKTLHIEVEWFGGYRTGFGFIQIWLWISVLLFVSQLGKLREVSPQDQFIQRQNMVISGDCWEYQLLFVSYLFLNYVLREMYSEFNFRLTFRKLANMRGVIGTTN